MLRLFDGAKDDLAAGNTNAAIGRLNDFIGTVRDLCPTWIVADAGDLLVGDARYVIANVR